MKFVADGFSVSDGKGNGNSKLFIGGRGLVLLSCDICISPFIGFQDSIVGDLCLIGNF